MYLQHWNLDCHPFECHYLPRFFFRSRSHQAALLKLRYLIDSNKGAGLLVGETGSGKSSLISFLASELDEALYPFTTLHYPLLKPKELIACLAAELGTGGGDACDSDAPADLLLRNLRTNLKQHRDGGRHPVIVLDGAHLIEDCGVFQTLQLILDIRQESPFTVILTGQPALLTRVANVPELDQRLGVKSYLQPLTAEETAGYIVHRLDVAGVRSELFSQDALAEFHALSGGLPRQVNRLADLALLVGYADNLTDLSATVVSSVADEITAVNAG